MSERSSDQRQPVARVRLHQTGTSSPATNIALMFAVVIIVSGCSQFRPSVPQSEGHIAAPAVKPSITPEIPPPARISAFVPPPVAQVKPQTYSVVVHEVQVKELLLALARDTKQNIDIHPAISGQVSLNAINETLPAILERISKQVNLRYRTEGNTIVVSPDTAYIKTYLVNYVNMDRKTTSTVGASGQISSSGQSGGSGSVGNSGASGGASSNTSSTSVTTNSNSDFWTTLEKAVKAILTSSLYQRQKVAELADSIIKKQEQELRNKQIEAAAANKAGAVAPATTPVGGPPTVVTVQPEDVIVNAVSGTITVNGNDQQHQLVQDYITKVQNGSLRQVLIEATIVEVSLSDTYQGGIDWSRLALSGGFNFTQQMLSGFGTGLTQAGNNFFQLGYTNPNTNGGNISATVKLLQEFGNARVLSSPKLMTLNNQTALLKVVDNLVYFEVQTTAGTVTSTGVVSAPTTNTTAKTVAIGVVMAVTPQVSEDGRVIMVVRPTITRLKPDEQFKNDPNPELARANRTNPVPQVQTREMESVLQVGSGQTVVLGGLMQDDVLRNREQIPGADQLGNVGELFRFRNESVRKTELVIFLRPIVITNPTLESDELKFFQRFLPQAESAPAPKPAR